MSRRIGNGRKLDGSNPYVARYRQGIGEPLYNEEIIPERGSSVASGNTFKAANARYGEFILYVLLQPGEELRHPRLGAHIKDTFGYTDDQLNRLSVRLGDELGVADFEKTGGKFTAVRANIENVRAQAEKPFIRDRSEILDILEHMPISESQE